MKPRSQQRSQRLREWIDDKPSKPKQRADYVPAQTGVRWDDDDRAIIRNLRRIFRKEGRGKMVDVLRAAIRELAKIYGCLPKRLQEETPE